MVQYRIPDAPRSAHRRAWFISLAVLVVIILFGARWFAQLTIEYQWWKELGQLQTWLSLYLYGVAPLALATILAFIVLWVAHTRALKFAGTRLRDHKLYARVSTLVLLLIGYLIAAGSIETWTLVRFFGSRALNPAASAWRDSVFGMPLPFYLFDLPFYSDLRHYLLALVLLSVLLYWVAARLWQLRYRLPELREMREFDASLLRLPVAWNPVLCAARSLFFCWHSPPSSSSDATKWWGTITVSWSVLIMSISTSRCRCSGC
jgi:uncharacterized membrane protein (UPF0182 family)